MGLLYDRMKVLIDDPDFVKGVVNKMPKGKPLNAEFNRLLQDMK